MVSLADKFPIRILHIVDDFSVANTGVTNTVRQLSGWQSQHCAWVGVYATGSMGQGAPRGVHVFEKPQANWARGWRYPKGGVKALLDVIVRNHVTHLHIHEFWRAGFVVGMQAAKVVNLPVVLSAHGTTSLWALNRQGVTKRLKKNIYWNLFARHFLPEQAKLHAITGLEKKHMEQFFRCPPDVVIPNALKINESISGSQTKPATPENKIVFLGRLHPVKGVSLLLEAFSQANIKGDWQLVIAGPEENLEYVEQLKIQAAASTRSEKISFVGPVYGEAKSDLLRSAWVVVAPSFTEVIGMVNIEAAANTIPTITTFETGLENWEAAGGVQIQPDVQQLREALEEACSWPSNKRLARGELARAHVTENYSMHVVGQKWLEFLTTLK